MKRSRTLSVSTTSCETKLRNRTLDVKNSRDINIKYNGCLPFSGSLFTSASSINTNHSRARLELLTARVTPTSSTYSQLGEDENKKLSTHYVRDESDPLFVRHPLPLKRSSTTISYEDLIRKYSCTSNDNSLDDYNPDDCLEIMKKYSATNGEDIMKRSVSVTSHGDVLRKYSVSGYDEPLQDYSPTKCKNILKKYAESETNQDREKSEYNDSEFETQSQRSSRSGGGKRRSPSKHEGRRRKRGEARNGSRLSKDMNSTTKIGNKIQNAFVNCLPKQKLRKGNTTGAPTRKTISKEGTRAEMNGARVSQTTVSGKDGADRVKDNSRKSKDSKMNLRNVSGPGTSSRQNLGRTCNTGGSSTGYNPALSIWGNCGREEEFDKATIRSTTLPHGENVDGYYDEVEEENGVRLYHLLSRQAMESSVVPSTPVDRKDLSLHTPGSIYEKMESEYRRKKHKKTPVQKSKTQMSNAITLKSHQRKHAGKLVLEKMKHNRAENSISRSLIPIESQNRLEGSTSASVCSDCLEGRFRQISCKDCHVIRYHEKIAGSQKRAYEVYAETGQRATKPGDLMEVVRYLNKSNMEDGKEWKKDEERKTPEGEVSEDVNTGVLHSSDNRGGSSNSFDDPLNSEDPDSPFDFLDDYVRLQTGGIPGKENVSPGTPLLSKNGKLQQLQQQENAGKTLDELRRQSVESWLKKRGRYLRCKLSYELNRQKDFVFA